MGKMRTAVGLVLLLLSATLLSACGSDGGGSAVLRADVARAAPSAADTEAAREAAASNGAFAWDLYRQLAPTPGNLFYSPHSISVALAMVYVGAAGDTATEMATTLHYTLPQDRLHPALNALAQSLEAAGARKDDPFELSIANAAWAQRGFPFLQSYLETIARSYGAGVREVDYEKDPEAARREINAWVEKETRDRIKDLIAKGMVDDSTRLVLANAVYFKADWADPFLAALTTPMTFTRGDGSTARADFMRKGPVQTPYAETADLQAVELPYAGERMSMVIVLPRPGRLAPVEAALDGPAVERLVAGLAKRAVQVNIPKFEFKDRTDLAEVLQAMGMRLAFDSARADFSGLDGKRDLYLSFVVHKAFVRVDEKGTEAAAATAAGVAATSAPTDVVQFTADRPFVFFIRDRETGATLFIGRVADPASAGDD